MNIETIPFQIPKIDQPFTLHIQYVEEKTEQPKQEWIHIYIYDSEGDLRVQQLFRGEPIKVVLSGSKCSEGCTAKVCEEGTWQMVLFSEYEIPKLCATVNDMVGDSTLFEKTENENEVRVEPRWYKGDFHAHTTLSDGAITLKEVTDVLQKNKLDFIFLTDHNMVHPYLEASKGVFSGMEITLSSGHVNIHGVEGIPFDSYPKLKELIQKDVLKKYDKSFFKGSNLSINHPFMKPWHFTYEDIQLQNVNTIEVMCDPTWKTAKTANSLAIKFLEFLNSYGHKIVGIGGSDAHLAYGEKYEWADRPSWYGDPKTCVFSDSCTREGILKAVRKGRVYIARNLEIGINICKGKYLPGDCIKDKKILYTLEGIGINEPIKAHLIVNAKRVSSKSLAAQECITFDIRGNRKYSAIAIEITNQKEEIIGYINAIYTGKSKPQFETWQEAVKRFEAQEGISL